MKQRHRTCLNLVAFMAVTTLATSLVFAALLGGVSVAIAGGEPPQTPEEQQLGQAFSGIITDAHCGSRHTDPQQSASGCVKMCVGNGSNYVIVNGDKKYELVGNLEQVGQLAGQRVSLIGVLNGNTINVNSAALQTESTHR